MDVSRVFHRFPSFFAMLLLILSTPLSVAARQGSNAESAHACQNGGYANWVRADDLSGFVNTGDCTSYTARGGELLPFTATSCVTEWASWARSTEFAVAFTSSQQCLDYLSEGGTIIPRLPGTGTVVYSKGLYPSTNPEAPGAGFCILRATVTVSGYHWIIITATGWFGPYSSSSPQSLTNSQYDMSAEIPWGMPTSGSTITIQGAYVGLDGTQVPGEYLVKGVIVPDSCP